MNKYFPVCVYMTDIYIYFKCYYQDSLWLSGCLFPKTVLANIATQSTENKYSAKQQKNTNELKQRRH